MIFGICLLLWELYWIGYGALRALQLIFAGLVSVGVVELVPMVLIGLAPRVVRGILKERRRRREAVAAAAHLAFLNRAGVAPNTGCDHVEAGTGVAINRPARTLSLRVGDAIKTYPFADIREWETSLHKAGQIIAGNALGALAALGSNLQASADAAAATGLFVSVLDIENPKWRIAMTSSATQARWMEILQQAINEG